MIFYFYFTDNGQRLFFFDFNSLLNLLIIKIIFQILGKLLILGTADFIKKNFGVGYNLMLASKSSNQNFQVEFNELKNELINLITDKIPEAKLNPQTAVD